MTKINIARAPALSKLSNADDDHRLIYGKECSDVKSGEKYEGELEGRDCVGLG